MFAGDNDAGPNFPVDVPLSSYYAKKMCPIFKRNVPVPSFALQLQSNARKQQLLHSRRAKIFVLVDIEKKKYNHWKDKQYHLTHFISKYKAFWLS